MADRRTDLRTAIFVAALAALAAGPAAAQSGQGPFAGLSDHMPLIGRFAIDRPVPAELTPAL